MFLSKFVYVIDHKTNGRTFFTNHNIAGFGLIAYNIYVRVFLALSPKMAPNSIKHPQNTSGTHPTTNTNTATTNTNTTTTNTNTNSIKY